MSSKALAPPFSRLPPEIITLIAQQVKESIRFEPAPFDFRWTLPKPWVSTIHNCCLVSKLFYTHFRPHLYASICAETVEHNGHIRSGAYFLQKLYELLQREPHIGAWIKEFRVNIVDHTNILFLSSGTAREREQRQAAQHAKWAAQDKILADVLDKMPKLGEPLKASFHRLFSSRSLTHVDIRSVIFPPSLIFSAPSLVEANLWYRAECSYRWKKMLQKMETEGGAKQPDLELLPSLKSFASDDPYTLVPDTCITRWPGAFKTLRYLRLYSSVDSLKAIQKFIDSSGETLKEVQLVMGVNKYITHMKTLDLTPLKTLKHLNLSYHGIPVQIPETFTTSISSTLGSLHETASCFKSFDLAMTWLCWEDFGAPPPNPPPLNLAPLFRHIDDRLAFLADKERFPGMKPVEMKLGCVCHRSECRVHRGLLNMYSEVERCLPQLTEKGLVKLNVLGRK
ncbi:hypothetical protein CC1G_05065 [Coprinopsis cinerea okayama7|uniref:F-box domain-containing protein n=1 Tax=Coprinopsis cinerea (strain Okayama-7 / 130 / ATCC MYA-4618 / FGSC 9003) TaxID=240176 RepID=A8NSR0_COPC7|nr:hypothetical protein CC1G_05065 [Coprinopsis cinerea okayama7\|eukprot:XP_001836072.2 hypothetical protein CC1G_05065 [Coprinopsis cinerea okayama7\